MKKYFIFAAAVLIFFSFAPTHFVSAQTTQAGDSKTPVSGVQTNKTPPNPPAPVVDKTPANPPADKTDSVTLINPLGAGTDLETLVNEILAFIVRIGAIVVVFMLIWVGWLFVQARGNGTAITKARDALLWTVVGGLILLGAQVISLGIQATVQSLSTGGSTNTSASSGSSLLGGGASGAVTNTDPYCWVGGDINYGLQKPCATAGDTTGSSAQGSDATGNAASPSTDACMIATDINYGLQKPCANATGN